MIFPNSRCGTPSGRSGKNKGAPGVDEVSLAEFETDLGNNLYKIWNRLCSGSYFPSPVKAVEIPKPGGEFGSKSGTKPPCRRCPGTG